MWIVFEVTEVELTEAEEEEEDEEEHEEGEEVEVDIVTWFSEQEGDIEEVVKLEDE